MLVLLAAAALLAGACSGDDDPTSDAGEQDEATDTEAGDDAEVADDTDATDDTGAAEALDDADAEADTADEDAAPTRVRDEPLVELPGSNDGEVAALIDQLERRGEVVELSFRIVNRADDGGWGAGWGQADNFFDGGLDRDDAASASIYGVTLVDGDNAQRHFALRDGDGRCACSYDRVTVRAGESLGLFASYPAPPDGVTEMTVQIPQFGSVDVPLS